MIHRSTLDKKSSKILTDNVSSYSFDSAFPAVLLTAYFKNAPDVNRHLLRKCRGILQVVCLTLLHHYEIGCLRLLEKYLCAL